MSQQSEHLVVGAWYIEKPLAEFQSINKRANAIGLIARVTDIRRETWTTFVSFTLVEKPLDVLIVPPGEAPRRSNVADGSGQTNSSGQTGRSSLGPWNR